MMQDAAGEMQGYKDTLAAAIVRMLTATQEEELDALQHHTAELLRVRSSPMDAHASKWPTRPARPGAPYLRLIEGGK